MNAVSLYDTFMWKLCSYWGTRGMIASTRAAVSQFEFTVADPHERWKADADEAALSHYYTVSTYHKTMSWTQCRGTLFVIDTNLKKEMTTMFSFNSKARKKIDLLLYHRARLFDGLHVAHKVGPCEPLQYLLQRRHHFSHKINTWHELTVRQNYTPFFCLVVELYRNQRVHRSVTII